MSGGLNPRANHQGAEMTFNGILEFKPVKTFEALDLVQSLLDRGDVITVYADVYRHMGEVFYCVVLFAFSRKISRAVRMYIPEYSYPEPYARPDVPLQGYVKKMVELLRKHGYNAKTPYD